MKTLLKIFAVALLASGCGRAPTVTPIEQQAVAQLDWLTDFEAAKARARSENKLLFIDFTGSDWCPPCLRLQKEVFAQPEFADYAAKNLVLLEVDFPRRKEQSAGQKAANEMLAEQFRIEGFPTILVLDGSGKILGQLGYMPGGPKPFIAELEKLKSQPKQI